MPHKNEHKALIYRTQSLLARDQGDVLQHLEFIGDYVPVQDGQLQAHQFIHQVAAAIQQQLAQAPVGAAAHIIPHVEWESDLVSFSDSHDVLTVEKELDI